MYSSRPSHEGCRPLSCGSTTMPRTPWRTTPWRPASTRCEAVAFCVLLFAWPLLTHARRTPLPNPSQIQSSCNLTKQMQAKKAKKSLNIIHIGNICERPFPVNFRARLKKLVKSPVWLYCGAGCVVWGHSCLLLGRARVNCVTICSTLIDLRVYSCVLSCACHLCEGQDVQ